MSEAEKETVLKLIHPVEEIRVRALNNLLSKLEFRISKIDLLVDSTDLCKNLLKWISE
jgi:hypothetical protein